MLSVSGSIRIHRLVELDARQIIEYFDQESDLPMRHHEALGVLEAFGAFGGDDLVEYVGAWWARIVQRDVAYQLLEGLECIAESRPRVEGLARSPAVDTDPLVAYVLARWHDAAGRIQFRCGDMMAARQEFSGAARYAEREPLWFCRPDILSNLRRAEFDEREKVGEKRDLLTEQRSFEALHRDTVQLAADHAINIAAIEPSLEQSLQEFIAAAPAKLDDRTERLAAILPPAADRTRLHGRELLRGLASVLHNLSIVCMPDPRRDWQGDLERSRAMSWQSALIAYGLGDGYRLAQALRHSASVASNDNEKATRWLEIVRERLPWERGRWIASQLLAARVPAEQARVMLENVLGELARRQTARGGDIGFDVDVHRWTIDALARVVPDEERDRRLKLEAARNIRRVVKVSIYRQRLAEVLYPEYLREIERVRAAARSSELGVEGDEATLAIVEEASARELLDLLAANRIDEIRPTVIAEAPFSAIDAPSTHTRGRVRGDIDRQGVRSTAYEAIGRSRLRFEQQALHRPIASATHDVEVAAALRRLTAAKPGLVVVRYYLSGLDGGRARALNAMIFRDGRVTSLDDALDLHGVRALAAEPHADGPSVARSRRIWDTLVAPIWPIVTAPTPPDNLVMIPAMGMFSLPMHVALPPGDDAVPLGAQVPFCMSVSATAYVSRRRYLLQIQPVDRDDDLCALVPGDDLHAGELVDVNWASPDRFHLAGFRPAELAAEHFTWWGPGNRTGLERLLKQRAEFFVYAGHGISINRDDAVEVALQLADGEYLTQYDLAMDLGLRRNKWALIDACVSGVGGDTASGEVAGFLRAFIAAGAGALAVTKWKVRDAAISHVAGQLLHTAAQRAGDLIDIVTTLREIQHRAFLDAARLGGGPARDIEGLEPAAALGEDQRILAGLHSCPLVVYL